MVAAEHGVTVEGKIVRARAIGEAIVEEAGSEGVDLIVIGSAPRWRRQARFFNPTVDYVLRNAPCEVMVIAYPRGPRRRSAIGNLRSVKALVIGCGRVGSSVALELERLGWEVTAIDENEDALHRLGGNWSGGFVLGHGMDLGVLTEAGIEEADAVIVATDGDNTNLVIGQVARKRFGIATTIVRVLDPARAALYKQLGLWTVSPTSAAIETLIEAVSRSAQYAEARN
jgi:trk system potassium uptake protein TrkA